MFADDEIDVLGEQPVPSTVVAPSAPAETTPLEEEISDLV